MDEIEKMKLQAWYNAIAINNIFQDEPKTFADLFGVSEPGEKTYTMNCSVNFDSEKFKQLMRDELAKCLMIAKSRRYNHV